MKNIIITGSSSGLGFENAKYLYKMGHFVIVATRNEKKALDAIERIKESGGRGELRYIPLDLTIPNSIINFKDEIERLNIVIDILVNNAGVFLPPYTLTKGGQELQFEGNFLGHFFLTYLLLPYLNKEDGRIISLGSLAHNRQSANIHFDDINFSKKYSKWRAYEQSKLACVLFGLELDSRLRKNGSNIKSIITHPGVAITELFRHMPFWLKGLAHTIGPLIGFTDVVDGSKHTNYAILEPTLQGGDYVGPKGRKGPSEMAILSPKTSDLTLRKDLWEYAEKYYNISFL